MNAGKLHSELEKHAPIKRVAIYDSNDKTQWVVEYDGTATAEQIAAAEAAKWAYVPKPNKTGMEVLLDALKAKGVEITAEDLEAAK